MEVPSNTSELGSKDGMKHTCENHTECMKMIQAILDGEASEEEKEHFRQNIDVCIPCIKQYHLEKCIKESLSNKIERKPCPENLVNAIKVKLQLL